MTDDVITVPTLAKPVRVLDNKTPDGVFFMAALERTLVSTEDDGPDMKIEGYFRTNALPESLKDLVRAHMHTYQERTTGVAKPIRLVNEMEAQRFAQWRERLVGYLSTIADGPLRNELQPVIEMQINNITAALKEFEAR